MARRPWLKWEQEYVLAWRGRRKLAAIAKHLGRSKASVVNMLVYYRKSRQKQRRREWEARHRRLHAKGLSDAEVAKRTGVSRGTAQRRRRQLGLAPNPARPGLMRARYQRQMERANVDCLADFRWGRVAKKGA